MPYKPKDPTFPYPTWIRVADEEGNQFDHRADLPLPDGQKVVDGYPEYQGPMARAPKAKVEIKTDRQALEGLAKDLGVTIGKKSDGELATAVAEAQAEAAAAQPATETEANMQSADAASESTNTASSSAGEGSE
jgi:hypothetical protein